jgi:hypothetical protein
MLFAELSNVIGATSDFEFQKKRNTLAFLKLTEKARLGIDGNLERGACYPSYQYCISVAYFRGKF